MSDAAIAYQAPSGGADLTLDELVNKLAVVRARREDALDRVEQDRIDEEAGEILLEFITTAGDQFEGWLPQLCPVVNVEMTYWKIGLDGKQREAVAAALDRFHGVTPLVASLPPPNAEPAPIGRAARKDEPGAGEVATEGDNNSRAGKRGVVKLSLSLIRADSKAQPRIVILTDKVSEYVEEMGRGDEFPPLIVFYDGDVYWLADGFHRYHAAVRLLGLVGEFDCDVRGGRLRDAVLFSCGANAAHGIRRTNEDKRRAAMTLLQDPEWSHWSDREIARQCLVNHETVGKYREQIAAAAPHVAKSPDRPRTVKRGRSTYTQNIAAPGKQKRAIERQSEPSPDTGVARERYPLDLPEFRVSRIEDELENLLAVERTPSDKPVSRSWMKCIRVSLEKTS